MIELTEKQRQELNNNGNPIHVLDPATSTQYVLARIAHHICGMRF